MRIAHQIRDGKRSELIAASWLMSQNCYVYTPFIEQGPIDLIALTPKSELLLFDVKTVGRRKDGSIISRLLSDIQKKLGVRLLYVDLETGSCALYPYQLSRSPMSKQQNHAVKYAERQASNRHFYGGQVPTIDGLVHPRSSQTDQSCSEESSQYGHQPCPLSSDQHTEQDDADQSDAPDPQTEHESQD